MRWRHDTAAEEGAGIARFAWLVSFFATLSLVAILALAKSAQALPSSTPSTSTLPPPRRARRPRSTPKKKTKAKKRANSSKSKIAARAKRNCEAEDEEGSVEAPEECLLSSVEATVFAPRAQDKLRLVVRYTAVEPSLVAVNYGLHGSKGSLYLGQRKQQFGRSGVFRQTETLSEAEMAKATGAKDFTVQLYAVAAPRFCRKYFERHLTARHAAPSGLTWADPESTFRR